MKKIAFIAAALLCLFSCGSKSIDGTWTVSKLGEKDVPQSINLPQLSIDSSKGIYGGCTGVNRLNGELELKGNSISFKDGAMTKMAADKESMALEIAYIIALNHCRSYEIDGNTLKLLDEDKKVLMELSK